MHYGTAFIEWTWLPKGPDGLRFFCDCLAEPSRFPGDVWVQPYERHLADAYHAIKTGRVLGKHDTLPAHERAYWMLVLVRDTGALEPVALPELPEDASEDLRRGRDFFALLAGRQLAATGTTEIAFARTLVAQTLGIERDTAGDRRAQAGGCDRARRSRPADAGAGLRLELLPAGRGGARRWSLTFRPRRSEVGLAPKVAAQRLLTGEPSPCARTSVR
jgi:hypothetical protein